MNLTFATPALLIGLLAAGIPLVLHLLASVRAPKQPFPSLRFLRLSMQRTARRRHVQHWLLLILRSVMLGLLALAVAEPVSRAMGFGGARRGGAAVIVLDNSMSMATRSASGVRLDIAKSQVTRLLNGADKPAIASLLLSNPPPEAGEQMTAELDDLRRRLSAARVTGQWAPLSDRIAQAGEMLAAQADPARTIYVFSDMQAISFDDLANIRPPEDAEDISLVIIDTGDGEAGNVSLTGLEITGHPIVNSVLTLTATLVNSSRASRVVDIALRVDGEPTSQPVRVTLTADGDGRKKIVRFRHRITSTQPLSGAVVIDTPDDLPDDNIRRFALRPAGHVKVLVVAGPGLADQPPLVQPAGLLELVLNPYEDPAEGTIRPTVVTSTEFTPADLTQASAAFFCEVQSFTPAQADAVDAFVRRGGTAMFFLGPDVNAENYNARFAGTDAPGLLPATLGQTVGQVGPTAPAIASEWMDTSHPYLAGLYPTASEYPAILVKRHVRLTRTAGESMTLIRLAGGDPLLVAKAHGRGRVVLSAVPASPLWSDLMVRGMAPGMVVRMALMAGKQMGSDDTYIAGAPVEIVVQLPAGTGDVSKLRVEIARAGANAPALASLPLADGPRGPTATFMQTSAPGGYGWRLVGPSMANWPAPVKGRFVINPVGSEGDLSPAQADLLRETLTSRGFADVTVAGSLTAAMANAADRAKGDNWWDVLLVVVIVALLAEVAIANRPGARALSSAAPN